MSRAGNGPSAKVFGTRKSSRFCGIVRRGFSSSEFFSISFWHLENWGGKSFLSTRQNVHQECQAPEKKQNFELHLALRRMPATAAPLPDCGVEVKCS